mmetsp:Transcript_24212/g.36393  ORF Transcript_24212/g.36393 Transcript_24212/m.36393 type:complete len:88 (+) Transcript_24212:63-326(+)
MRGPLHMAGLPKRIAGKKTLLAELRPHHSFDVAAVPAFMDSTYLMLAAVRKRAALRPETRPNTTQSSRELPPRRLLPWIPPAASPAE